MSPGSATSLWGHSLGGEAFPSPWPLTTHIRGTPWYIVCPQQVPMSPQFPWLSPLPSFNLQDAPCFLVPSHLSCLLQLTKNFVLMVSAEPTQKPQASLSHGPGGPGPTTHIGEGRRTPHPDTQLGPPLVALSLPPASSWAAKATAGEDRGRAGQRTGKPALATGEE